MPINTRFRDRDLTYVLRQPDSAVLITHDVTGPIDYAGMVGQAAALSAGGSRVEDKNFPGVRFEAEDVIDFCRSQVASFKIPRHVVFVDEFPMTASGKIRKADLREEAKQRFAAVQENRS